MDEEITLNLEKIEIAPLERDFISKFSQQEDGEHQGLVNWFRTIAVPAQDERKSKTYVAMYEDEVIGYIAISMSISEVNVPELQNSTSFNPQMILIAKMYICPEYRSAGVGTKLLEFVTDMGQKIDEMIGCTGIIVDANNNTETLNFYKKFGFVELNPKKRTVTMFFKIPEAPVLVAG